MKKGKLSVLAVAAIGACCGFAAVGCANKGDDAHTHEFGDWAITEYPTAEAGGKITRTCTANDGGVETVDIPALSDTAFWTVQSTVPAGHTTAERITYANATYNISYTADGAAALGHTWGDWEVKDGEEPTAEAGGKIECKCTADDGGSKTQDVPKLSDTSFWTVQSTVPAGHTTPEKITYSNATYSVSYTVDGAPATGHTTWGPWTVAEGYQPTADKGGKITRKCTANDGGVETKDVPALSDTEFWTVDGAASTDPTHAEPGATAYKNATYNVTVFDSIPAVGHRWSPVWSIKTDEKPTLTAGGKIVRTCLDSDGGMDELPVPALSDTSFWKEGDAVNPDCTNTGSRTFTNSQYSLTQTVTIPALGHAWGEWEWVTEPTLTTDGQISCHCTREGCDAEPQTFDVKALNDSSWTKQANAIVADYNTAGYDVYKCNVDGVDGDVTVKVKVAEKLTAPYDNKKYVSFDYVTENINRSLSRYNHWAYNSDNAGNHTSLFSPQIFEPVAGDSAAASFNDNSYPSRGHITIEMMDYSTGKVKIICREAEFPSTTTMPDEGDEGYGDGEGYSLGRAVEVPTIIEGGTVTEMYAYVDKATGILVLPSSSKIVIFVPVDAVDFTTTDALNKVDAIESTGSVWDGGAAVSVKMSATSDVLNLYIKDNEVIFGAKFKDLSGNNVAANDCYNADYLLVTDSDDNKIASFGKKDGALVATDGLEGTYSGTVDTFDVVSQKTTPDNAITVKLNGAGSGLVTDGAYNGMFVRYEVAPAGSDYTFGMYIVDGSNDVAYYKVTKTGDATVTTELSLITITFDYNNDAENAVTKYFGNIATDIAPPETTGFLGWYNNAEGTGSPVTEVKSATDVTIYAKWSTTSIQFKLYGEADETFAEAFFAPNDSLGDLIPELTDAQKINTADNTRFIGWFTKVDGVEYSADPTATLAADDANAVFYGKWSPLGIWSFEMDNKYGWVYDSASGYWKSNNKGINSSTATMKIFAQGGDIEISFKAWANSEGGSYDYINVWHYWLDDEGSEQNDGGKKLGSRTQTIADAQEFKFTLHDGDYVKFDFRKDGSTDGGEDHGYLADLVINGRPIAVAVSPDFDLAGTYTGAGADLVLDPFGNFTWGEKAGMCTAVEGQAYNYDMYVVSADKATEYYELTITGDTYSVNKPMVDVTYSAADGLTAPQVVSVNKNIELTLAGGIENSGYKFRGWYTKDGTAGDWGDKVLSVVPTADTTVYGRYDAQATITWNFLVDGVNNETDTTKFVGDSVENVAVTDGITNVGKVFIGWYTKDGTADDWGEQVTADTVLSGETVTFYAKWVTPHAMYGNYVYKEIDPSESAVAYSSQGAYSSKAAIDVLGAITGFRAGSIESFNEATGDFSWKNVESYGTYIYNGNADVANGFAWLNDSSGQTTLNHDIYFLIELNDGETVKDVSYVSWGKGLTKLIQVTYGDDAVKTVFIHNGKVYGSGVSWSAVKADNTAITNFADIKDNADYLEVTAGSTVYGFAKSGAELVEPEATRGTYKCDGKDDLFLNGGCNFTWGAKSGTYAAVDGAENTYKLLVKADGKNVESHNVVIDMTDPSNRTYTATENKVTITFVTAHSTQENVSAWADVDYTLPTLTEDGYTFRGWYNNDGTTGGEWGSKIDSVTPELGQTYTYYAKWDAAVTITWNFLVSNVENAQETGKFVNDAVGTVKPIGEVTNGDLTFVGWFTKDGTADDWGEQVTADTVLSSETVTFYAKWIEAHALMGVYNGVEFDSTSLRGTTTAQLVIDAYGNVTGQKSGALTEVGDGVYKIGDYYMYYDSVGKAIVTNYGSSKDQELGTDLYVYILVPNKDVKVSCSYSNQNTERYVVWNGNKTKIGKVTVGGTETLFFVYDNKVYGDVTVLVNDVETSDMSTVKTKGNVVTVKDAKGTQVYKAAYDGSAFVFADGLSGDYSGEYGAISIDGYGNLTLGSSTVAYTIIDGRKISFVLASRMYIVTLGDGSYTKELDGYEGTYTLPDGAGTVTLDGYGMAGASDTYYIVNDNTLTIFNPTAGTSVSYGIEKGNYNLIGKSIFAGTNFKGSYTAGGYGATVEIKFDDAAAITGQLLINEEDDVTYRSCAYNISAVLDGNTLTVTVLSKASVSGYNSSLSSAVGKTFTMEYNSNANPATLKFTSTLKLGYVSSSLNNVETKLQK